MSAPVITVQPQTAVVASGSPYTLSVTAYGSGPLSYQWQKDGQNIADTNNSTLTVNVSAESHRYRVFVFDSLGATVSSEAIVLVSLVPAVRAAVFSTVSDMVADHNTTWGEAHVANYAGTDKVWSYWVVTTDPSLTANGSDILTTAGGLKVVRTYARPDV